MGDLGGQMVYGQVLGEWQTKKKKYSIVNRQRVRKQMSAPLARLATTNIVLLLSILCISVTCGSLRFPIPS